MLAASLAGLTVASWRPAPSGPNYRTPKPDVPAAVRGAARRSPRRAAGAPATDLATWWRALGDPELDSLVERAIKSNLDLEIALTRLQQARTYEAVVAGTRCPRWTRAPSAARGTGYGSRARPRRRRALRVRRQRTGLCSTSIRSPDSTRCGKSTSSASTGARSQAARYDAQAAAAARNGVLTSVVADVVRAYIDLRGVQIRARHPAQASDVLRGIAAHREYPLRARHHQRARRGTGDPRAQHARSADRPGAGRR